MRKLEPNFQVFGISARAALPSDAAQRSAAAIRIAGTQATAGVTRATVSVQHDLAIIAASHHAPMIPSSRRHQPIRKPSPFLDAMLGCIALSFIKANAAQMGRCDALNLNSRLPRPARVSV